MLIEQSFDTGVVQINYAESCDEVACLRAGFVVHGKSGRVAGRYRPKHYVMDVATFLENQVVARAILFGHSLGVKIALLVAAQQKEKVATLILGDSTLNLERLPTIMSSKESLEMWCRMLRLAGSWFLVPELATAYTDSPLSVEEHNWAKALSQLDPEVAQYHAQVHLDENVEKMDVEGLDSEAAA